MFSDNTFIGILVIVFTLFVVLAYLKFHGKTVCLTTEPEDDIKISSDVFFDVGVSLFNKRNVLYNNLFSLNIFKGESTLMISNDLSRLAITSKDNIRDIKFVHGGLEVRLNSLQSHEITDEQFTLIDKVYAELRLHDLLDFKSIKDDGGWALACLCYFYLFFDKKINKKYKGNKHG